jgi:hypothetical protein
MSETPKTEWIIKDQIQDGIDSLDGVVSLDFGPSNVVTGITVATDDGENSIEFNFAETHALVAALKAALKEWTRRGVV